MNRFTETWPLLPETVRRGLLVGSEGKLHLMHLAQELLAGAQNQATAARKIHLDLGMDLLQTAWSKDPLDGQLAGQLLALDGKWPCLDPRAKALAREVAARWQRPEDLRYYRRLAESRDSEKLRRFLLAQLAKEGGNLYWWQQVVSLGMFEQDQELLGTMLRQDWSGLEPCRKSLAGDVAWLSGKQDAACGAYAKAFGRDAELRRAERLFAQGREGEARALWLSAFQAAPWLTSEILRVFDLTQGTGMRRDALPGRVAIALYSYNKAEELDATLHSLFASDTGDNPVWVLDNGSSDGTAAVLDAWEEKAGGRLRRIDLHVNIGAPAARNWLMSVPEIRECDWMAYLDDDVELPGDWLQTLGAAVAAYPEAGVWGCKVVDHAQDCVMQSTDLHLVPPVSEEEAQRRFKVSDLQHQTLDFGQFDYLRPCASVTGCCHLFRMDRLQDSGGFDLRFSPTQFDDLEHDIRLNRAGQYAVYQGFLGIRHKKRTGKSSRTSTSEFGNSLGNMHKLQMKYSAQDYEGIMAWESEVLLRDFMRKRDWVMRWLTGGDA
jgi:GT2 family glycosyltransferase